MEESKNTAVLFAWVQELLSKERYLDAEKFAGILYSKPQHNSVISLAEDVSDAGSTLHAIRFLESTLKSRLRASRIEKFEILHLKGRLLAQNGNLNSAERDLREALKLLPRKSQFLKTRQAVEYQLGSLYGANGKFKDAQCVFDQDIPVNCGNGWVTSTKVLNFSGHERSKQKSVCPAPLETLYDGFLPEAETKLVYFVGADLGYCKKFVLPLVKALVKSGHEGVHFHLHGVSMNGYDENGESWRVFISSLEELGLSFSITHASLLSDVMLGDVEKKSVYSVERFRILPDILDHYNLPVLVADIDQLPLLSPLPLLNGNYDVAFLRDPKAVLNILSVVSATLSIFKPSSEGTAAAKRLSHYFHLMLNDPSSLNWHVDQAGLAVIDYTNVTALVKYLDTALVITDPKQYTLKDAWQSGSYFWSVTNSFDGNIECMN